MATSSATMVATPRIDAADFKARLAAGEPAIVLDVRAPDAWDSSREKVRGAMRASADHIQVDPCWPKNQLIVAYCT